MTGTGSITDYFIRVNPNPNHMFEFYSGFSEIVVRRAPLGFVEEFGRLKP